MLTSKDKLPDLEDIINNMRSSDEYWRFCETVMRQCFGCSKWRARSQTHVMSTFLRPSFEAFVLLAYENVYGHYKARQDGETVVQPFKYTANSVGSRRNQGWPNHAIERYNDYVTMIKKDRLANVQKERDFMDRMKVKFGSKKRKLVTLSIEEIPTAVNDFEMEEDGVGVNWTEV